MTTTKRDEFICGWCAAIAVCIRNGDEGVAEHAFAIVASVEDMIGAGVVDYDAGPILWQCGAMDGLPDASASEDWSIEEWERWYVRQGGPR